MAGTARAARGSRSRYTAAGSANGGLYIASVPAGSKREALRDLNRRGYAAPDGYRADRPWRQSPEPAFEQAEPAYEQAEAARPAAARRERRMDLSERLYRAAMREKRAAALCVVLAAAILMVVASWGQKMVEGVDIQKDIARYQEGIAALEQQNRDMEQQIESAKLGDNIRIRAQNELGMLRPERAEHVTISIKPQELAPAPEPEEAEEPKLELLDLMLGLLSVFHIGE